MDTVYPIFYGTRLVTFDVLVNTFSPYMHPEAARRGFNFVLFHEGKFGIGGGYRPPGTQPANKPGFAPPGKSFHEGQRFPSGLYYAAWDMVVVNPGSVHRTPQWNEVPKQGSGSSYDFGWHMNNPRESWHAQPIELDGYDTWVKQGRPDLPRDYPISVVPPIVIPPASDPIPDPTPVQPSEGITVQINSRNLTEGDSGKDVAFFQRQLNEIAGQGLTLDGQFGPMTTQAVKNWQNFFKLEVDGQLGPITQASIIEVSLNA